MPFETDFKVSDPAKIAWIFQSIKSARQLVSVAFSGGENAMLSAVIEVDRKKKCFSIDALEGSVCHDLALAGESFELTCSLNGVEVTAQELSVQRLVEDPDGAMYIVDLPAKVQYQQRRSAFRARVTGLVTVPVQITLFGPDGTETNFDKTATSLSNMSAEGCRIELSGMADSFDLDIGQHMALAIYIPDHDVPLQANVKLCHKRFLTRSKLWCIGCQFLDLDTEAQGMISRFVVSLQTLERKQEEMFRND